MRRCRFHITPGTSGCVPDIGPAARSPSFRALTAPAPLERRVLLGLRMTRLALLFLCLLPLVAGAQEPPPDAGTAPVPPAAPAESAPPEDACVDGDETEASEELASVLGPLQLRVEGSTTSSFAGIELKGLRQLPPEQVGALVGLPTAPGTLTAEQVALVLTRLARTGLFAKVTPTVRLVEGAAPVLEVVLEEQPLVTSVDLQGLRDYQPTELLERMFHVSRRFTRNGALATLRFDEERGRLSIRWPCPRPRVPREWLARFDDDTFQPGLVRGGLPEAMEGGLREMRDDGYLLASLTATLRPDGRLEVVVDEGRVASVDVVGVDAELVPRVREALGLQPGDVFLRSDARRALERLEAKLPFLEVEDVERAGERRVRLVEEVAADGSRTYRPVEEERPRQKKRWRDGDMEIPFPWVWSWHEWDVERPEGLTLEERRVVVHVRPRRPDFDVGLLPVHTQVTGFAPGLEGALRLWDPKDRVHGTLEAAFFVPLRLGGQRLPDDPEGTRRQRELNWLAGAKVAVPGLRLAELGVQGYDFTDSFDRWRMGRFDSWLYSFLLNRPDADYFRRSGLTGFATWRPSDAWLVGAEVRRDSYATLRSFSPPLSLFRDDSPPFPNAPVDEGDLYSVVGRLEYASDAPAARRVGSLFRNPEVSLLDIERDWPRRTALRSLLTVEVGDAKTTGVDGRFWKVVSDNAFYFITGHDEGLRLRARAAGGDGLPLQKQEGIGGWSALRGYGFKELRGTASLLTSAEYRWDAVGAFVDVGTVRREGEWTPAKLGVGLALYLGDEAHLAVAWRTDERASWTPEARLLFSRPF